MEACPDLDSALLRVAGVELGCRLLPVNHTAGIREQSGNALNSHHIYTINAARGARDFLDGDGPLDLHPRRLALGRRRSLFLLLPGQKQKHPEPPVSARRPHTKQPYFQPIHYGKR